ncbi:MAG: NUDIX hydrolase [Clostridia bacterium]|nr:NUDIX hydrolase [Clostridia bacterium]
MVFNEKTITSEKKFEGRIFDVRVETVELPDGKTGYRELVDHPGGVGILAITNDNKIIMVSQYRKAVEKELLEIPAGKLERGEDPLECGIRELEEETGYKAKEFIPLGYLYPSPGFANETTYLFLAKGLYTGKVNPDEDEYLDILEYDIHEVWDKIMANEITDAKTVIAFFKGMTILKNKLEF